MKRHALIIATIGVCLAASLFRTPALADEFPTGPIRLIVLAPAGSTDTLARSYGLELAKRLGQPVLVDNRPGASGNVGMEFAARSRPDGHTLVVVYQGLLAVNPVIFKDLSWDPLRDFVPVAYIGHVPIVLVVNPNSALTSVQELIRVARAKGAEMNYGSAGSGTTSHLAMELFKRRMGSQPVHVPYKGESLAVTDLMGDRLTMMFSSLPVVLPLIRSGKLRALAVASKERSRLAPEIPANSESGLGDFEVNAWFGVMAPAGTPAPIVERLSREFNAVGSSSETRARLANIGVESDTMSSQVFGKWMLQNMQQWQKVVLEAGIKRD